MVTKALVAASSKPLILSILRGGESYGYEIIQKVRELSGGELEWADGMLYPVLHRMEKDGFVSTKWKISKEGRRRKYYRLTPEGREELIKEMKEWESVNKAVVKSFNIKPALNA